MSCVPLISLTRICQSRRHSKPYAPSGHGGGYVSEFVGDKSVFRSVDAPGLEDMIKPGDEMPLDDVFCRHIMAGRLPELMPDVAANPFAMTIPIMQKVPIGRTYECADPP